VVKANDIREESMPAQWSPQFPGAPLTGAMLTTYFGRFVIYKIFISHQHADCGRMLYLGQRPPNTEDPLSRETLIEPLQAHLTAYASTYVGQDDKKGAQWATGALHRLLLAVDAVHRGDDSEAAMEALGDAYRTVASNISLVDPITGKGLCALEGGVPLGLVEG
jgi:hypothetical protein